MKQQYMLSVIKLAPDLITVYTRLDITSSSITHYILLLACTPFYGGVNWVNIFNGADLNHYSEGFLIESRTQTHILGARYTLVEVMPTGHDKVHTCLHITLIIIHCLYCEMHFLNTFSKQQI